MKSLQIKMVHLKVVIALASLHYKANYMVIWLDESMYVPLTS